MRVLKSGSAVWSCIRKCDGNFGGQVYQGCGAELQLNLNDVFTHVPSGTKITIFGAHCPECGKDLRVESHLLPKDVSPKSFPNRERWITAMLGYDKHGED